MKQGLTLVELAREIERQQATKKDIVASTSAMRAVTSTDGTGLKLAVGDRYEFGVNDVGHQQIAQHAGIPSAYYNRMRAEAPDLLRDNVNCWFHRKPAPRMVRTVDNVARAFLSDQYRPLENQELANAVLPPLMELGVEVMSCQITDTRMYIKAVDPRVRYDMPAGSKWGSGHTFFRTMSPGIVISNSEVGMGALKVESSVFDKICTNLATMGASVRKTHLGARHEITDGLVHLLSDQTRRLSDAAFWHQIRDVVKASFDEARFVATVKEKVEVMVEQKIEGDPVKVVELSAKKFGFSEGEKTSILRHLIEGGDLSRFGLYNAITRTAEDVESYDRASDFEQLGGKIVELPATDWAQLARAA